MECVFRRDTQAHLQTSLTSSTESRSHRSYQQQTKASARLRTYANRTRNNVRKGLSSMSTSTVPQADNRSSKMMIYGTRTFTRSATRYSYRTVHLAEQRDSSPFSLAPLIKELAYNLL
eukprot:scaffold207706_cov28-Prasinocladus_malaysianus.AAC.1